MSQSKSERPLRLILPEGPVGHQIWETLLAAGLPLQRQGHRSLHRCEPAREQLGVALELLVLHHDDIPAYVEHGLADLGVASAEVLFEANAYVYRPYTFSFEQWPVVLAAPENTDLASLVRLHRLRVATRYRRLAREHFAGRGWPAEIIGLGGDPCQAVALGLASAALTVLRNPEVLEGYGLRVVEEVDRSQLKLIANRAASRTRMSLIERLVALLEATSAPARG